MREDAILLYGFATIAEKHAFDLLMGVQHSDPSLALAVLSVLSPQDLVAAITQKDVERIDAVPGVGAKVAYRIVRELRDKIGGLDLMPACDCRFIERACYWRLAGGRCGLTDQPRLQTCGGEARR